MLLKFFSNLCVPEVRRIARRKEEVLHLETFLSIFRDIIKILTSWQVDSSPLASASALPAMNLQFSKFAAKKRIPGSHSGFGWHAR